MPAPVRPGDVLADKYRVDRVLGEGAMGCVIGATNEALDQPVALKLMRQELTSDAQLVARFIREAKSCAKLKSQHVVRVFDVGTLDSGVPYIVMEMLTGNDLSHHLRTRGRLTFGDAALYIMQACSALDEAHAAGIVHRDLKPANLFLTKHPDGVPLVKILDFGISKAAVSHGMIDDVIGTETNTALGSPLYMAPEQMRSAKDVDLRADLWSLGVILYELVAGPKNTPFTGTSLGALVLETHQKKPKPLEEFREDVAPEFRDVVMRCLELDPDKRFASARALMEALAPFASVVGRPSIPSERKVDETLPSASSAAISARPASEKSEAPAVSKPPAVSIASESAPATSVSAGPTATVKPWSSSRSSKAPAQKKSAVPFVLGALLLLGGLGWLVVGALRFVDDETPKPHPNVPASSPAVSVVAPPTLPIPTEAPTTITITAPADSASSAPIAHPATPPRRLTPTAVVPTATASAPATAAVSAPPAKPVPDCNPPYYFDKDGFKHRKPDCLDK